MTQELIKRMKAAIEGECDGLAITDEHAKAILGYVLECSSDADERAAFEEAAAIAEGFGPSRPIVAERPSDLIRGRWEGEQAASSNIARLIRERAALASTRTASDTRTAAGEAECDAALGRAAPAGQHVDEDYVKSTLVDLAARGASAAGLSLCAQLLGVGPCDGCGYRKIHCRCIDPHPFASTDAATRSRAEGGNTCATCSGHGSVGRPPDDYFDCPDCSKSVAEVDVEAERVARHAIYNLKQYRPGQTIFPGEAIGILERFIDAAARTQADAGKAEPPTDPMDWPLPCDVKVGAGTITKGCKLRTLVTRMNMLHRMAMEGLPKVTPEQQAAFFAMFPHLKPADSEATTKPENT